MLGLAIPKEQPPFFMTMSSHHFIILASILISTIIFILFIKQKTNTKKLPPGPNKLPLIGNLHQLGNLPHRSLECLANKYGPLMHLQLGSVPTLIVSSADIAREIFKNHDLAFSGRPILYAAKRFSYNCNMTFAPYGDYWREIRKIVLLELLSAKRVQSFSRVRNQEVASMVKFLANSRDTVNLSDLTIKLANNVIRRVVFGENGDGEEEFGKKDLGEMLEETQGLLGGFCLADFFPRMGWWNKINGIEAKVEKNFEVLDMYYDQMLEKHLDPKREAQEHEDLVDVLLRLQKDPNQPIRLKNENIKGVLTDMFIAGTDTSSAALVWIMTELIKHPSIMKKVQNEIREIINSKSSVEEADLSKFPYMKMVIKEGLRLHPPAPLLVPRETNQSCKIGEFEIPPKTRVFINAKAIATDPNHWENPMDFCPERFLDNSVDFRGQHFEYLPFGVGRRSCPGINFAISLIELSLANMLYMFDWLLPQGMGVEDIDMEEAFGLTMHKKVPLCLVASMANIYFS